MKKWLIIVLFFLASLRVSWSLLQPGFFPSDDGEWMIIRLSDFHRSLVSGQIPVRWAARLNYSYGYPVFNFLYPLSLYLGEAFHLVGFSFVSAIKIVFGLSLILSGVSMYFLAKEFWGKLGGLVSAIFYLYAPYHLTDVYSRGSLGEVTALVFPPLILLFLYRLSQRFNRLAIIGGALAYAGLITAHNIAALLFSLITICYLGWLWYSEGRKKELLLRLVSPLVLGLGLSTFFWLPAIYDLQFTIFSQVTVADYRQYFLTPKEVLNTIIGWPYFLVILLASRLFFKQLWLFILFFLLSLFLVLPVSLPIWEKCRFLRIIQFPWRWLMVNIFFSSLVAGALIKSKKIFILTLFLITSWVVGSNWRYAVPQSFFDKGEAFYTTNEATTTVKDEYLPVWVKNKPLKRAPEKVEIISGIAEIPAPRFNSRKIWFSLEAKEKTEIQVNTLYFPGWRVKIDDKLEKINYQNDQGVMRVVVPAGKHQVEFSFGETPIRLLADLVSVISLGVVIWLGLKGKK